MVEKQIPFVRRASRLSGTLWIIIITALISVIGFVIFAVYPESYMYFALNPVNFVSFDYTWTIIAHIFFHGSLFHLFVNMFALFSIGNLCERIIGRKRYIWFYLASGIFAGLCAVFLSYFFGYGLGERIFGSPELYMIGASGALFALAGLITVLLPRLRFSIIFLPFFSLPAYIMVPLILFVFWILSAVFAWPIGNSAHFGGFLFGVVYGLYLRTRYKRKVLMLQRFFDRHS